MAEPARLTRQERRAVWISAATFLAVLLFLFFIGLFLPVNPDTPLLPGFYFVVEVIAASSAGVLGSTLSGFFKLELEHTLGTAGRFAVQAGGGFAVFVLVMMLGPRNQMAKLADLVFANLARECEQAVTDGQSRPNAKALCTDFAKQYPGRPEPWRYLAMWHHRNAAGLGDFEKAAGYYARALEGYGATMENDAWEVTSDSLTSSQRINLPEVLTKYGGANADYELWRFAKGTNEGNAALATGLTRSESALNLSIKMADNNTSPSVVGAAYDELAKIALYRFFLFPERDTGQLKAAVRLYNKALLLGTSFNVFLNYHKLVTVSILNHEGPPTDDSVRQESTVLQEFIATWNKDMAHPDNARYQAAMQTVVKEMMANRREESFTITLPFGSQRFGGEAFVAMLERHGELADQLRLLL